MSKKFEAWEFFGQNDPFFGGNADDRRLGQDGLFHSKQPDESVALFNSESEAIQAGHRARNARKDGLISASEVSR